jgi:nucleoside-diphosphate-sugar epimerase
MKFLVTGGSGFIGTNLIEQLEERGDQVLNLDLNPPKVQMQGGTWRKVDLKSSVQVAEALLSFEPDVVIHLAAKADFDGKTLEDFNDNIVGSSVLYSALIGSGFLGRLIVTSTQYVIGPGGLPIHDTYFNPNTLYGESKVKTEMMLRESNIGCCWTIIRPTNVWGPWHPRFPSELWRYIKKGLYVHPGGRPIVRAYGYVGNVVQQILAIADASEELVSGKVLYVGDEPIDSYELLNRFSVALRGKRIKRIPHTLLKAAAMAGDLTKMLGLIPPISSDRLHRMTTDHVAPMERTFSCLGRPHFSIDDGIQSTCTWLRKHHSDVFG